MIKLILIDDHELVRSGIEALLKSIDDIEIVGVCGNGEQALDIIAKNQAEVVLIDINMPRFSHNNLLEEILQLNSKLSIIGLSIYNDGPLPSHLKQLGVKGFISKRCSVNELLEAIRSVAKGEEFFSEDVDKQISLQNLINSKTTPFSRLSRRESEVVKLILQGRTIPEMSKTLVISDKTINTYRYRLYQKLAIKNDVELTRMAVKYRFIEADLL